MQTFLEPESIRDFSEDARRAVYDVIALRRDIRHFRADCDVSPEILERILGAAHLAPSVGFSQPWGFVVIRDLAIRGRIRDSFLRCREAEAARYPETRREAYLAHRLEGILEAPVNVCVAVDLRLRGDAILGTTAQPEAVRASACCAVQNLWLAARAEGIGVGWVSIVEPAVLRAELSLPAGVEPIAYLCIGHPIAFRKRPMLEETGWHGRTALEDVIHPEGRWVERRVCERPFAPPMNHECRRIMAISDSSARRVSRAHQLTLTKPPGSLGRLEDISAWYSAVRGVFPPPPPKRATVALFAADHGVVVEGVSAYGSQITAAMVGNVMAGGAAINVFCAEQDVDLVLTDVGVAGDLSALPTTPLVALRRRSVRAGTRNLRREPAMATEDARAAIDVGRATASEAIDGGADVVALGEIGIGNTTAAAALVALYTASAPSAVVGRGTGVNDDVVARKIRIVEEALARHGPMHSPIDALARIGGFEIAAMVGCALEAARRRIPVVLDGFVTNAAALVAAEMDPGVRDHLLAAHVSPEPGARLALERLALRPVLDLELRLGEGTGAVLAIGILRVAVRAQLSMASFATAGIVGRPGTDLGNSS